MIPVSGSDMLIQTRSSLDKLEGFRNKDFQDEEIQMYINKGMYRLLDDLINKNFEQGTIRYEWLRPFLKKSTSNPVVWTSNALQSDIISYEADMHYLVSASATASKDAIKPSGTFEGDCIQGITDVNVLVNEVSKIVQININETGEAIDQTHNYFYGNNVRSPKAEAFSNGIVLYRDNSFILKDLIFDYVIIPTEIDVSSPTATQWPTSANQVIIDYTVEYMRLTIEDPGYQGNVNDLNLRTQKV